MKKFVVLLLVAFLLVGVLSACAAPATLTQTLVGVPTELQNLISALLTAALTWLLIQAGLALKIDLTGYVAPLLAIISPIVITLLTGWLGLIPTVYDDLVLAIIHVIVIGIGSLGTLLLFKRKTKATLLPG